MAGIIKKLGDALHIGGDKKAKGHKDEKKPGEKKVEHSDEHKEGVVDKIKDKIHVDGEKKGEKHCDGEKKKKDKKDKKKKHDRGDKHNENSSFSDHSISTSYGFGSHSIKESRCRRSCTAASPRIPCGGIDCKGFTAPNCHNQYLSKNGDNSPVIW